MRSDFVVPSFIVRPEAPGSSRAKRAPGGKEGPAPPACGTRTHRPREGVARTTSALRRRTRGARWPRGQSVGLRPRSRCQGHGVPGSGRALRSVRSRPPPPPPSSPLPPPPSPAGNLVRTKRRGPGARAGGRGAPSLPRGASSSRVPTDAVGDSPAPSGRRPGHALPPLGRPMRAAALLTIQGCRADSCEGTENSGVRVDAASERADFRGSRRRSGRAPRAEGDSHAADRSTGPARAAGNSPPPTGRHEPGAGPAPHADAGLDRTWLVARARLPCPCRRGSRSAEGATEDTTRGGTRTRRTSTRTHSPPCSSRALWESGLCLTTRDDRTARQVLLTRFKPQMRCRAAGTQSAPHESAPHGAGTASLLQPEYSSPRGQGPGRRPLRRCAPAKGRLSVSVRARPWACVRVRGDVRCSPARARSRSVDAFCVSPAREAPRGRAGASGPRQAPSAGLFAASCGPRPLRRAPANGARPAPGFGGRKRPRRTPARPRPRRRDRRGLGNAVARLREGPPDAVVRPRGRSVGSASEGPAAAPSAAARGPQCSSSDRVRGTDAPRRRVLPALSTAGTGLGAPGLRRGKRTEPVLRGRTPAGASAGLRVPPPPSSPGRGLEGRRVAFVAD